jgi:arylformamidase
MSVIWDISPPISSGTPAFPGDTIYAQRWTAQIDPDCPVNVSAITLSPHLGAHADAPLHYARDGGAIGAMALDPFIGPCRVLHAIQRDRTAGTLITPAHIAHAISDAAVAAVGAGVGGAAAIDAGAARAAVLPPRVLVRTCASARMEVQARWSPDFAAFAPETIAWLASLGVRLVGIDTPSVDPADSKTLDSHQQLLIHDMRVLENLVLDDVPPGDYELIALPLKLIGADASPVRAVLRSL